MTLEELITENTASDTHLYTVLRKLKGLKDLREIHTEILSNEGRTIEGSIWIPSDANTFESIDAYGNIELSAYGEVSFLKSLEFLDLKGLKKYYVRTHQAVDVTQGVHYKGRLVVRLYEEGSNVSIHYWRGLEETASPRSSADVQIEKRTYDELKDKLIRNIELKKK